MTIFLNRSDAGRVLAQHLLEYQDRTDVIVLALPRGGVPVGYEVARALRVPLDIFLVRKLGVPGQEELAMGAIASGGVRVLNQRVIQAMRISDEAVELAVRRELRELERRESSYRGDRGSLNANGKVLILVDDGLATGASMRAAAEGLRQQQPAKIVVAVPTAAPEVCQSFEKLVDQMVCATTPEPFLGVGMWYEDFAQTSDEEVRELLRSAQAVRH